MNHLQSVSRSKLPTRDDQARLLVGTAAIAAYYAEFEKEKVVWNQ
jgi:hypothetical protein